jgi:maleate isomerase
MTGQKPLTPDCIDSGESRAAAREYGRAGLFGILTPQGNPTVEPEMRVLLPHGCAMLVSRLVSHEAGLRERLIAYGETLENSIAGFDGVAFDALGFACTGSSYLFDPALELQRLEAIETRTGYPVFTAAQSVAMALNALDARAVALISPYPDWLTRASHQYWEALGFRVTTVFQIATGSSGNARGIYALSTPAVLSRMTDFDPAGADAVLITGTGMPSLRLILALGPALGLPVLSSNLCLAWALTGGRARPGPESPLYGGWAGRMALA